MALKDEVKMMTMGTDLADRLHHRRFEIEQAMLARACAVANPAEIEDTDYVVGLRDAIESALDYGIASVDASSGDSVAIPDRLLAQARAAARNGVSLDTVLRRYLMGYTLLGDYVGQEAEAGGFLGESALRGILRRLSTFFDRLVVAISEEYTRELEGRLRSSDRRRAEKVRTLLTGEPVPLDDLHYELDAWHLAMNVSGPGAAQAVREFAIALDRGLLLVRPDEKTTWAWLGGRSRFSARETLGLAERTLPADVSLALGELGHGVDGWRLSHRQANAAMAVVRRGHERKVLYADVALLASALRDEVLAQSLQRIYLAPLEGERDGGVTLRKTLAAYFEADRNGSSTAAALGVSRRTVGIRLRAAEERIGRPVAACAAELETALRLRELTFGLDLDRRQPFAS